MSNPIILSTEGDESDLPIRILSVIWEGATSPGDTVTLVQRNEVEDLIWAGRTDLSNTYQGAVFGTHGIHAPLGVKLQAISAGRLMVYLREG